MIFDMHRKISLKTIWYGLIIFITLLPVMILLPWLGFRGYPLLQQKELSAEYQFNDHVGDHLEEAIDHLITVITNKTDPIALSLQRRIVDKRLLHQLLLKVVQREKAVVSVRLRDGHGQTLVEVKRRGDGSGGNQENNVDSPADGYDSDGKTADIVIPMHGRTYIGPIHEAQGISTFHLAVPVMFFQRALAVFDVEVDAGQLWSSVESRFGRPGEVTYLVDRRGMLLNEVPGGKYHKGDLLTHLAIVRALLANQRWDDNQLISGLSGQQVFGVVSSIDKLNWGLITEIPRDKITGPITRILSLIALVVIICMSVIGVIGLWLVTRMLNHMEELSSVFEQISHGDYSRKPSASVIRELQALISGVNHMSRVLDQREAALRKSEQRLQAILDNSTAIIAMKDCAGCYILINRHYEKLFAISSKEILGKTDHMIFPDEIVVAIQRNDQQVISTKKAMEFEEVLLQDGRPHTYISNKFPLIDHEGMVYAVCSISTDITERIEGEARFQYLAYHDVMTGLANRTLFMERLQHAISRRNRDSRILAILFMDLDRFKDINDCLGHDVGDALLKILSERLVDNLRQCDTIARFGGDEFAILLEDQNSIEAVSQVAEKLLEAFSEPFVFQGHELYVTASIGISIFPDDSEDAACLLKNADMAMYRAKELGRNLYQFFSADMGSRVLERLRQETHLRHALERNEYFLEYQPQIDLVTQKIIGVEALLRWRHPELGIVSPEKFIPALEDMGLIVAVGEWVLKQSCLQAKSWLQQGFHGLRIAVNLSVKQFHDPLLFQKVKQTLEETGIKTSSLELEITESVLMQHDQVTMRNLKALYNMGVRLSIDDFGTGYSSLSYLKRFPLSTLKIDRSFISDIIEDPDDAAIVTAIIAMGHSLRLDIVAEGVETGEQYDFLRRHSCDYLQGYLFSRPVSPQALATLLDQEQALVSGEVKKIIHSV